jgi:protein TonB
MPRHNSAVVISVLAHVAAIAAYVLMSIVAPEAFPMPHRDIALPEFVKVAPPPPPPTPRPPQPAQPQTTVPPGAAPLVAQEGIREETGLEQVRPDTYEPGIVDGAPAGTGLSVAEPPPPPPPAPEPKWPVRLHSGIAAPRKIADALPVYPPIAQATHTAGIVIVEVVISERGEVTSAKILRSIPLLDAAALDAVKKWRFEPARLNGDAIPIVMTVTVNFQLNR